MFLFVFKRTGERGDVDFWPLSLPAVLHPAWAIMVQSPGRNTPRRRRNGRRWRSSSSSPRSSSCSPVGSPVRQNKRRDDEVIVRPPQPYMKQVKLHPSGCQQWSTQVVAGGGIYMAYASTLIIYVYDVRDYSLVCVLGGSASNVHSVLWHPRHPHRLLVFRTNGQGAEWDVRSEERVRNYNADTLPAYTAWDSADPSNLAVISKESKAVTTYLLRKDCRGKAGGFCKGYTRRSIESSLGATCAKWSQYEIGVLVVGWTDGRVSFSEASTSDCKGKSRLVFPSEDGGEVVDLRHDPHGGAYVLVAYRSGSVVLWDAAGHSSVTMFNQCAVGLAGVRWMAWASGNFLALSSKTGVARVFNISQDHPIGTVRLGDTGSGVRDMAWLPAQLEEVGSQTSTGPRAICGFQDGSLTVADVAFGSREAANVRNVVGGGGSGRIPWASKAGHIETVFTCAHRPGDADTLATGSYGSRIKVWHVPTMDLKVTLHGQTGAIYSLAWNASGDRIASTSGNGTVWIWDAESGKAEQRLRLHSRAVHRVQWDPFNKKRLASASADKSLAIFGEHGVVQRVFVHPAPLFGCHWCPGYANIIATGCQDGKVRVYDVSWTGMEPQYVLSGHSKRVFHVCWSPLLEATLASGSDDGKVMVWCLDGGVLPRSTPPGARRKIGPRSVLQGHTNNVRPLHWDSEIPWLLLSGSWDGTVRAWDIRRAGVRRNSDADSFEACGGEACIAVMSNHVADVYGISSSPGRPFLYVSVSRDTTIRQFTLEGVVSSIRTRAVVENTIARSMGSTREAMLPDAPTLLCGRGSQFLETQLRSLRRSGRLASVDSYRRIFAFFSGADGMDTFWEILRWVTAAAARTSKSVDEVAAEPLAERHGSASEDQATAANYDTGDVEPRNEWPSLREMPHGLMEVDERVIHRDARRASDGALARLLAISPTFIVQDRRVGRCDRVERAARLHLATGDLQSTCDALVSLGKWERALALAPGVSTAYWKALAARYVEVLRVGGEERGSNEPEACGGTSGTDETAMSTALLVSTGRSLEAIEALGESDEALTLAVAVAAGAYPSPASSDVSLRKFPAAVTEVAAAVAHEMTGNGGQWTKWGNSRAEAANGSHTETGGEAKLLALLNDPLVGSDNEGRGECGKGRGGHGAAAEEEEGKASPKDEGDNERREEWGSGLLTPEAAGGRFEKEFKAVAPTTEPPSPYDQADLRDQRTMWAVQRDHAEAALHSITHSRAEAYFKASQPALAAAALLSVSDGTRATAAPALSLLLRGEEPELAYGAAKALRFPAREIHPVVREMARRAEAWGDSNLSAELLSDTAGEDTGEDREIPAGGNFDGGGTPDTGYWPAVLYGTCGEEGGPRGAVMIASRCRGIAKDSPSLQLGFRSKESYLEDAASAVNRGMHVEAVRLLVLGRDIKQAAERGVSFLRETLSASSPLSPCSLQAALAVTRALGTGPPLVNQVSLRLRAEVLAYSSYVGALEAAARGYYPIVAPLLRNTLVCVQLADRLALERGRRDSVDSDEKTDGDGEGGGSPNRRESARNEISPASSRTFLACMSEEALTSGAVQHLTTRMTKRGGSARITESVDTPPHAVEEMGLTGRRGRSKANDFVGDAKAVDDQNPLAEHRVDTADSGVSAVTTGSPRGPFDFSFVCTDDPEAKSREDDNGVYTNGESGTVFETRERTASSYEWSGAFGEIIVSGSRLPSCCGHERLAWKTAPARGNMERHERSSLAGDLTIATHAPDFGQQTWDIMKGATHLLEDGVTAMGLNNAVMWAKVNPFSPLNTGSRIMPF